MNVVLVKWKNIDSFAVSNNWPLKLSADGLYDLASLFASNDEPTNMCPSEILFLFAINMLS